MQTLRNHNWNMYNSGISDIHFPYYRRMNHFSTCLRVTFCAKSDGEDCIQCNNGYRLDTSGLGCIRIIGGNTTNISYLRCTNKNITVPTSVTREDFEYFNTPDTGAFRNFKDSTNFYCQIRKNTTMFVDSAPQNSKLYLKLTPTG